MLEKWRASLPKAWIWLRRIKTRRHLPLDARRLEDIGLSERECAKWFWRV